MIFFVILVGSLLLVLGQYILIYIITSVFIIIRGVLMYTINTSTKTGVVYSYEVLVVIGAGLVL
jgi:hypothetical protein